MDILALQRRLSPLLRPAGTLYGAAMRLRAKRYADGADSYRARCPVVSVGNISWGGTGKTPVVDYLLDKTAKDGLRAVVLTRGYKADPPELPFPVSLDSDPAFAGDEPLLLARRHPEALVVVDPKRSRAAAWVEAEHSPDIFLLDDGMQHLAMQRDLDIVLLAPDDLLDQWDRVIPSGSWREGKAALARADVFCIKAEPNVLAGLMPVAEKRLGPLKRPLFSFSLRPAGLTRLAAPGSVPEKASDIGGSPYTLLCGTGNPAQVAETATSFLGRAPEMSIILPDHHRYTQTDVENARRSGHPVICTAKDAVKLAALLPAFKDTPVWILDVKAVFGPALFTDRRFEEWWREHWRILSIRCFG